MRHRLLLSLFALALLVLAAQVVEAPTRPIRPTGPMAPIGGGRLTIGPLCWWPLCEIEA